MRRRSGKYCCSRRARSGIGPGAAARAQDRPPPAPQRLEGGAELSRGRPGDRRGHPTLGPAGADGRRRPRRAGGRSSTPSRASWPPTRPRPTTGPGWSRSTGSTRWTWPSGRPPGRPRSRSARPSTSGSPPGSGSPGPSRRLIDYVEAHRGDSRRLDRALPALGEVRRRRPRPGRSAAYEGARTVQARSAALKRLTGVLGRPPAEQPGGPLALFATSCRPPSTACTTLPNLDVSADVASVSPFLANDVVNSGPIARDGYVSQVTAGPRTGLRPAPQRRGDRLLQQPDVVHLHPDHRLPAAAPAGQEGPQGRQAVLLPRRRRTTRPQLTITAIIRPSTGLSLSPAFAHSIGAAFDALPIQGKGLARGVLAVLGLNREKLTQKVAQQAIPKIAQGVVQGANDEAAERIPGVEAQQNAKLRQGPGRQQHGGDPRLPDHRPVAPLAARERPGRRAGSATRPCPTPLAPTCRSRPACITPTRASRPTSTSPRSSPTSSPASSRATRSGGSRT